MDVFHASGTTTKLPVLGLDPEDAPAARHERPLVQVARVEVHPAPSKLLQI